ncbi:hypothetical protein [Ralstonia syzygii]|uniref:hypothetical protein n=1 Tax=Ralstonia syzygii TaxID=28097 RepID=UPI0035110BBE
MKKTVAVGESGLRIGEDHQNAKLTNAEVDLLLGLRAEGWSYRQLASKFEISKSQARNICKGLRRCQTAVAWRVVHVPEG